MTTRTAALYEYMDDASIDSDLLCSICREPCKEPYLTPCDHLFCRQCITQWHQSQYQSCPNCRQRIVRNSLRSAPRIVCEMINQLRVNCKQCGQQNLSRVEIDNHISSVCSKSIVPCSSVNIKCSWLGQRDQLDKHLAYCMSMCLAPTVDAFNVGCRGFKRKFEEFEEKCKQDEIELKSMIEDVSESIRTTADIRNIDLSTMSNKLEESKRDIQFNSMRLNTLEQEANRLKTKSNCALHEIERANDQFEQHEIAIKQFTQNFQLMQELLFDNRNSKLEESLEQQQQSNSSIDLSRRQLIDEDMKIIVQWATKNQQCQELDLRQNLITEEGVTILTHLLNTPSAVKTLHLSGNTIHDTGVFHLTNALSASTSVLTKLDLDCNGITYEGATYLANMLKTNQTLEYLSLNNNHLGNAGMQSLGTVLATDNRTLKELHISDNQQISDATINSFIRMIQLNQSLVKFNISNCDISEGNKIKLQQVTKYKSQFSLSI